MCVNLVYMYNTRLVTFPHEPKHTTVNQCKSRVMCNVNCDS